MNAAPLGTADPNGRSSDVLGLGAVAFDELLYVKRYPLADEKVRVEHRDRQCGGLTATALVAATRLGARCAYAGVLGIDELSRFAISELEKEGVDLSRMERRPGALPTHSMIVVAEEGGTRTIFFDTCDASRLDPQSVDAELVCSTGVLLIDHHGSEAMIRAARLAREARIPVVADFEVETGPRFPELLRSPDHLILSREFAQRITGEDSAAEAVRRLWNAERKATVLTAGTEGCVYLCGAGDAMQHQPAFSVETVDTTGCGDVFHGAYAAGLARGYAVEDCVRLASAAAALKAKRAGGQRGIPRRDEVESFLAERTSSD